MGNSRTGNLDRFCEHGKDIISQWIAAKTLGLRDLNIDNDNFHESIDLSEHSVLHNIDVKSGTFICKHCRVNIHGKKEIFPRILDTLIVLCMNISWKRVERVYIVPYQEIYKESYIDIYEDWSKVLKRKGIGSRFEWIENFRVNDKLYNDTYHTVDIPRFFSPFDLWEGKYNTKTKGD